MHLVLLLTALTLVLLNLLATVLAIRDKRRLLSEVVAEVGLIWLVPFFGALVSLAIGASGPETVRNSDATGTAAGAAAVSVF